MERNRPKKYLFNDLANKIPEERTYHSAEFVYPYLVVFGGEALVDLDDLWVFNFETEEWTEV